MKAKTGTSIDYKKIWGDKCAKFLVNKTITRVRYLTEEEVADMGWYSSTLVIFFNDGSFIYSSRDDEGNDAGALFTSSNTLPVIPVV